MNNNVFMGNWGICNIYILKPSLAVMTKRTCTCFWKSQKRTMRWELSFVEYFVLDKHSICVSYMCYYVA